MAFGDAFLNPSGFKSTGTSVVWVRTLESEKGCSRVSPTWEQAATGHRAGPNVDTLVLQEAVGSSQNSI